MCFESVKAKMKITFMKNELEADIISEKAQHHIASAGSCITKGLQVHDPAERRIKKINDGKNKIPCTMYMTSHRWAQR